MTIMINNKCDSNAIKKNCEEGDREEKSLSGRLLAPRATDEWLNEVPVGILKQAFTAALLWTTRQ